MSRYDEPRIPPSTPPVVKPQVDEDEASRAPVDGDDTHEGKVTDDELAAGGPRFDPANGAVPSGDLEKGGASNGEVLKGQDGKSEYDRELDDALVERSHRDGAGETEMDQMPPD